MRIERLEVERFSLKPPIPFTVAYASFATLDYVLLKVYTDNGLVGLGEAAPDPEVTGETQESALQVLQRAAPSLAGRDPFALEALLQGFEEEFYGQPSAMAALDMALYDLQGKALGVPVHQLLGGMARPAMDIYPVVPLMPPQEMADLAALFVRQGFLALKLKVGTNPDEDQARVQAVRQAVGSEVRLRIDVNQGWHTAQVAIPAIRRLSRYHVEWIEQPVDAEDLDALAEVTQAVKVPIMVDEGCLTPQDALAVVYKGAANLINIKLMKCGGLYRALQVCAIAEAAGIPCIVGSMGESSIASAAGLHLFAARQNLIAGEVIGPLFLEGDIATGFETDGNRALVPLRPGLGVQLT
jgi:L-alanine-DL-glutamate epimerase-like enolase superfamily enzyme